MGGLVYAGVTWLDIADLFTFPIRGVLSIILALARYPFSSRRPYVSFKRYISECNIRFVMGNANIAQLQYTANTTEQSCAEIAKARKEPIALIEELEGSGKIIWMKKTKTKKVLLYCHGGAFILPALPGHAAFSVFVGDEMIKRGIEGVDIAMLSYTMYPAAPFPTNLRELCTAVTHLQVAHGLSPGDIFFAGDSAGANLILQLISHLMHPVPDIPIPVTEPLGGALLLSPWVVHTTTSPSFTTNDRYEWIPKDTYTLWGTAFASQSSGPYVEAINAPQGWFDGIERAISNVLVTVGKNEGMYADLRVFEKRFESEPVEFVYEDNGVHIGPIIDFIAGEKKDNLVAPTAKILDWFEKGFLGKK